MKLRSLGVPIERRTVAPAPSDWDVASKTLRMPRGVGFVAVREGSSGGMTGYPTHFVVVVLFVIMVLVVMFLLMRCLLIVRRMLLRMYSFMLSCCV